MQEKINEIRSRCETYQKYRCKDVAGNIFRFALEGQNTIFLYSKGRSRYGRRISIEDFVKGYTVIFGINPDVKWHNRIKRIVKCLNESGLWPEYKEKYENLYKMSLEDKKAIHELYWTQHDNNQTKDSYNTEMQKWISKYPFIDKKSYYKGYIKIDTFYIWEMSEAKTKSMYFGKTYNQQVKTDFKKALENKEKYSSGRIQANYDVRLEYNPEENAAWYSEEYRDCANGHYYMCIGPSMAVFCEND